MTPFIFTLAALACFRLTVLVSRDIGPFRIFQRLRKLSPKWLGCVFCFSITAAAIIETGFLFCGYRDSPVVILCSVLAMSAIAVILDRTFTTDHNPDKTK